MDTRRASSSSIELARGVQGSGADRLVRSRAFACFIAMVLLAPLVLATFLKPDPSGHGTHEQLGMPVCGWAMYFGKPCVTCGMTTAFAHSVRGQFLTAATTQPMGLALALALGVGFCGAMHSAITGSATLELMGRWLVRPRVIWSIAALLVLAWAWTWTHWPV